jgi:multiple antibiotic resistance protein
MLGPAEVFTLLFVMLGPIKILGPFAQRTQDLAEDVVRRVAWWTFVVATIAAVAGGFLGRALLEKWQVSNAALMLAGGIVFFVVALQHLLQQYAPPTTVPHETLPASPIAAACRLVSPMVLTPYGVAAVIALFATSLDAGRTAMIVGLIVLVLFIDLIAMLLARRFVVGFTVIILQVLGAVLAILQVALAIQLILSGLRSLDVIRADA